MATLNTRLYRHAHHFLFGLSLASLVSLLIWWSIFIHASIQERSDLNLKILESEMKSLAHQLSLGAQQPLAAGPLRIDRRFEIVPSPVSGNISSLRLPQPYAHLYLKPSAQSLAAIEGKTRSLKLMLFGESGLLALVVLVSVFFLYRHIQLEKSTVREIHEFWERSAHEIKTPLTGIKTFLQNLRNNEFHPDELQRYTELALSQLAKQEKLAENILAGHHMVTEADAVSVSDVALKPFLLRYFDQALHLSNAELLLAEDQIPELLVKADEHGLKVIIDNITDNAAKYCPPGLKLRIGVSSSAGKARIVIQDNGAGLSAKQKSMIFEAFKHQKEDLPGSNHGSGIGLYLSRRLAREMGGDLVADSAGPHKGARFSIILRQAG